MPEETVFPNLPCPTVPMVERSGEQALRAARKGGTRVHNESRPFALPALLAGGLFKTLVAQLDRVSDFEFEGCGFDPLQAYNVGRYTAPPDR